MKSMSPGSHVLSMSYVSWVVCCVVVVVVVVMVVMVGDMVVVHTVGASVVNGVGEGVGSVGQSMVGETVGRGVFSSGR